MAFAPTPLRLLTRQSRSFAPALLAGSEDPHAELMALVWGPRFDREHALGLWAGLSRRQPVEALPILPMLLSVADRFDALAAPVQHRLRRLIARHRASRVPVCRPDLRSDVKMQHAPDSAH